MKKVVSVILTLVLALGFVACDKDSLSDNKVIGVMPIYVGEPVTDENHEFTADDFTVRVAYEVGQGTAKEFDFEVVSCEDGYYTVNITVGGMTEPCFVDITLETDTSSEETDASAETAE